VRLVDSEVVEELPGVLSPLLDAERALLQRAAVVAGAVVGDEPVILEQRG
jgi:hypothetical protein